MEKISVVIISYNGKEFLRKCLKALKNSSMKNHQTIVVDDFSNDGTQKMISEEFSEVEFIRNEKNLGPTASRNKGAKIAKGESIVFLDNDSIVEKDTIIKLSDFLDENKNAGIVGPKIIPEGDNKMMWWNIGYDPNYFRESIGHILGILIKFFPFNSLKNLSTKFIYNYSNINDLVKVDWVVEPCFIIRRSIFEKISGFDEQFWMFYEGPDLCKRVRNEGYEVYFYPEAKITLLESHTHSSLNRALLFSQSRYRFYKKYYFYNKSNPIIYLLGRIISGALYQIICLLNKLW